MTNESWIATVTEILGSNPVARERARSVLWQHVFRVVVYVQKLPLGPLSDDIDARRDVAVATMRTLEAKDFAQLREWLARQRRQRDHAKIGRLIQLFAGQRAIELARASRMNLSRRGERFVWAKVAPRDPAVLEETVQRQLDFIASCTAPELYDFLERTQAGLADDPCAELSRGLPKADPRSIPLQRHRVRGRSGRAL